MGSNVEIAFALGALALALPRKYAFAGMLAASAYTTFGDAIEIGGLSFYAIRIVIVFLLLRVLVRGEAKSIKLRSVDWWFFAWLIVSCLLYVAVDGRYVSFNERLGYMYDVGGLYFIVRALIRTTDDLAATISAFAVLMVPLAILFTIEATTGRNPFASLGGVPLWSYVRNGKVRCQGPFKHSILAGTFGATAFSLFVGLWVYAPGRRLIAGAGALSALIITFASASSGPFSALFVSLIGLGLWAVRDYMRFLRRGLVLGVLVLAAVMKAPVWFIIDRFSDLIGGDGWYRSKLIDSAVNHINEWWLIGTGFTAHWMETGIPGNPFSADIVNEFVNQGIRGGFLALGLFILVLVNSFKAAGVAAHDPERPRREQFFYWALGCSIASHVASFFSVTYFDQIISSYYLVIGGVVVVWARSAEAPAVLKNESPATAKKGPYARTAHWNSVYALGKEPAVRRPSTTSRLKGATIRKR